MNTPKYLRCFNRQTAWEMAPGFLLLVLVGIGAYFFPKGTPGRAVLSGLAALGNSYLVLVIVASIRRLDELQQRIHLIAIAASFTATGMVVASAGLLEKAGLPIPPPGLWLWFLMVGVWGVGLIVVGRRYR